MPVPLNPDKLDQPSVLTPELLAGHNAAHGWLDGGPAPEAVVLLFHRGLAERIADSRGARRIEGFFADWFVLDEFDGRVALAANFGIGAPAAAVTMEDAASSGARMFCSVGTCGGLQPGMQAGDAILVTEALRDEGTSYHYLMDGAAARPAPRLTAAIRDECATFARSIREGASWTTDAPYRETGIEVLAHRDAGVQCVEMEAAATFAVAQARGLETASLLVVSDVVEPADWTPSFHADVTIASLEQCVDVAIACLVRQLAATPGGRRLC